MVLKCEIWALMINLSLERNARTKRAPISRIVRVTGVKHPPRSYLDRRSPNKNDNEPIPFTRYIDHGCKTENYRFELLEHVMHEKLCGQRGLIILEQWAFRMCGKNGKLFHYCSYLLKCVNVKWEGEGGDEIAGLLKTCLLSLLISSVPLRNFRKLANGRPCKLL